MSLTRDAYDDRFWRDGGLHVLRKIAEGCKIPDHIYGWSTASSNRFESLNEHLQLLTILVENRQALTDSSALQEISREDLERLHLEFEMLRNETSYWVGMLSDLARETERLEYEIKRKLQGAKSE